MIFYKKNFNFDKKRKRKKLSGKLKKWLYLKAKQI